MLTLSARCPELKTEGLCRRGTSPPCPNLALSVRNRTPKRALKVCLHSTRNACTGLIEAARRAGIHPATVAASVNTTTAPASTQPSTDLIS